MNKDNDELIKHTETLWGFFQVDNENEINEFSWEKTNLETCDTGETIYRLSLTLKQINQARACIGYIKHNTRPTPTQPSDVCSQKMVENQTQDSLSIKNGNQPSADMGEICSNVLEGIVFHREYQIGRGGYNIVIDEKDFEKVLSRISTIQHRADISQPCETCEGDAETCASVPSLRHCEKAQRELSCADMPDEILVSQDPNNSDTGSWVNVRSHIKRPQQTVYQRLDLSQPKGDVDMPEVVELTVVGKRCVYINDYRVCGDKPYVSENLPQHTFKVKIKDILQNALGVNLNTTEKDRVPHQMAKALDELENYEWDDLCVIERIVKRNFKCECNADLCEYCSFMNTIDDLKENLPVLISHVKNTTEKDRVMKQMAEALRKDNDSIASWKRKEQALAEYEKLEGE